MLTIFEPGAYHAIARQYKHGIRTAFEGHGPTLEWDYLDNEPYTRFQGLINRIEQFEPDLLFLQIGPDIFTPDELAQIRRDYPKLQLATYNGDYWPHALTSPDMLAILRHVDVQLVVNASVLDTYAAEGIRAALWPFGYETALTPLPDMPAYDVVYLGNAYSEARHELERILRGLPYSVGIYGSGWQQAQGNTTYDFPAGEALYANAKLTISDNQFADARGYLSNRPFQAMAAGCFVLQQTVKRLRRDVGWRNGVHYIGFNSLYELPELVRFWLTPEQDEARQRIAAAGQREVVGYHSFEARVDELIAMLTTITEGAKA